MVGENFDFARVDNFLSLFFFQFDFSLFSPRLEALKARPSSAQKIF